MWCKLLSKGDGTFAVIYISAGKLIKNSCGGNSDSAEQANELTL